MRTSRTHDQKSGFTAIELLVAIAIVAVLASVAMPNFISTIDRWRVRQASESLQSTLLAARSEAVQHGGGVTVERNLSEQNGCTLSQAEGDWSCGWSVKAGSAVLRHIPPPAGATVVMQPSKNSISLDRYGYLASGALRLHVGPIKRADDDPAVVTLCVNPSGKMVVLEGAATCP